MSTARAKNSIDLSPVRDRVVALGLSPEIIERESMYAARLIEADANLQKSDPTSIALAVIDAASLGVTLNPTMNYAYLENRWDSKRNKNVCYFRMMYQGISYLAIKGGAATSFSVQVVYKNDDFHADLGNLQRPIVHGVTGFNNRGDVDGAYAMAVLPDGSVIAELIDRKESDKILATSKSPAAKAYPDEFRRKTVLKRLCKRLSKGFDESPLARAIEVDNREYDDSEVAMPPAKPEPKKDKLTPGHRHWNYTVQKLATGEKDVADIKQFFSVSDDVVEQLLRASVAIQLNQEQPDEV